MPDAAKDHNATRIWQETYLKEKWLVPPILSLYIKTSLKSKSTWHTPDNNAVFLSSDVCQHVHFWSPQFKLSLPVRNSRQWSTDNERLVNIALQIHTQIHTTQTHTH